MGKFGWSLPPGVSMRDIDPPDQPCGVCGKEELDHCICPECPVCLHIGDPECYQKHGLVRTPEQIASFEKFEADMKAQREAEEAYWARMPEGEQ